MAETRRLFFAVWPDPSAAKFLYEAAHAAQRTCAGRAMRPEMLHITLAFLGDISPAQLSTATAVAATITGEPFVLTLDRLDYWKHNRILWAGGVSLPLVALAEGLAGALRAEGFRLDARPFAPHVTLLRDARCEVPPELDAEVIWPVREFVLAESRSSAAGAGYRTIAHWPLG